MSEVSAVPPHDPDFRPSSYWDLADPIAAILQNVKGQRRREILRHHLISGEAVYPDDWEEALLSPSLPARHLRILTGVHQSWLGGERLPDYLPGEVEIARLVLSTPTRAVFAVRARREDGTIRFRMVGDEDHRPWTIQPESSPHPLAFAELCALILSAAHPEWPADGRPLDDRLRSGMPRQDGGFFVHADSEIYPGLREWCFRRAQAWAQEQLAKGGSHA